MCRIHESFLCKVWNCIITRSDVIKHLFTCLFISLCERSVGGRDLSTSRTSKRLISSPFFHLLLVCVYLSVTLVCDSRLWVQASSPVLHSWHARRWICENGECYLWCWGGLRGACQQLVGTKCLDVHQWNTLLRFLDAVISWGGMAQRAYSTQVGRIRRKAKGQTICSKFKKCHSLLLYTLLD